MKVYSAVTGAEAVALRRWRRRYFALVAIAVCAWLAGFFLPSRVLAGVTWEMAALGFVGAGVIAARDVSGMAGELGAMTDAWWHRAPQTGPWFGYMVGLGYIVGGLVIGAIGVGLILGWPSTPP